MLESGVKAVERSGTEELYPAPDRDIPIDYVEDVYGHDVALRVVIHMIGVLGPEKTEQFCLLRPELFREAVELVEEGSTR